MAASPGSGRASRSEAGRLGNWPARLGSHVAALRKVYVGGLVAVAAFAVASYVAIAQKQDREPAPAESTATAPVAPTPQRVETIVHGSWNLTCQHFADPAVKTRCAGILRVTESKSRQVIFAFALARNAQGQLIATFQTPTGVLVQKGIELRFGTGALRRVPFVSCEPQHCDGSAVLDQALATEAAASETAEATIHAKNGRRLTFKMNQSGIDKVLEALQP
jgi:invasion protein IalB